MSIMAVSSGSPAPKPSRPPKQPRNPRQHRHTKSGSSIPTKPSTPPSFTGKAQSLHSHPRESTMASPQPQKDSRRKRRGSKKPKEDGVKPASTNGSTKNLKDASKTAPITILKRKQAPVHTMFDTGADSDSAVQVGKTHSPSAKATSTPGKAYAIPTFHHSPAPSTLPIPKFFSKSLPTPAPANRPVGLQAMMEEDESSDGVSLSLTPPSESESVLQKLFRADKEEKERLKVGVNDSSDSESSSKDGHGSLSEPDSPIQDPFKTPSKGNRPSLDTYSSEPIFGMDMDKSFKPQGPTKNEQVDLQAKLRLFLFQSPGFAATASKAAIAPPANLASSTSHPIRMGSHFNGNASLAHAQTPKHHRPSYHPNSAGGPKDQQRLHDFEKMENDLRRILKLKSPMAGGVMV